MSEYIILTDSSCDLPPELAEKLGIEVLPLTVTVGGKDYKNYLDGREIAFKDFYARVRGGENAVTAAVNMDTFLSFMKPFLEKGIDILYLGFSSALSGTVTSGAMAADELREQYPDRKIYVVDTKCASMGQGL
ncbi:MAG: DegV family EDD domain-containing protein, partial [Oscillospiraceae bacterium]|nr:DegV family EDD domain-containing protein [Oscillospiraceae bacterium]